MFDMSQNQACVSGKVEFGELRLFALTDLTHTDFEDLWELM